MKTILEQKIITKALKQISKQFQYYITALHSSIVLQSLI